MCQINRELRIAEELEKSLLIVTTGLAFGGAESQLVSLSLKLKARGWQVNILSLTKPRAYCEILKRNGIDVHSLGIRHKLPNPYAFFNAIKIVRHTKPTIVHSHMVHANLFARILRIFQPFPVLVCSAHSINEGGLFREVLYRLTDPLGDITTQVSMAGLESYIKRGVVSAGKIIYVPNGVDLGIFKPDSELRAQLRQQLGLEGNFVFFAVGRFCEAKDYPNLIHAFNKLMSKHQNIKLAIVGHGEEYDAIVSMSMEFSLQCDTIFLGSRSDVHKLLNAADAFVISSKWEGLPCVLLEAAAMRLPIVATDVGGISQVIKNSKSGYLVTPGNPVALAKAMESLLNITPEERMELGNRVQQIAQEQFTIDKVVSKWEELYWQLFKSKKHPETSNN